MTYRTQCFLVAFVQPDAINEIGYWRKDGWPYEVRGDLRHWLVGQMIWPPTGHILCLSDYSTEHLLRRSRSKASTFLLPDPKKRQWRPPFRTVFSRKDTEIFQDKSLQAQMLITVSLERVWYLAFHMFVRDVSRTRRSEKSERNIDARTRAEAMKKWVSPAINQSSMSAKISKSQKNLVSTISSSPAVDVEVMEVPWEHHHHQLLCYGAEPHGLMQAWFKLNWYIARGAKIQSNSLTGRCLVPFLP